MKRSTLKAIIRECILLESSGGKKYKLSSGETLQVHDESGKDMDGGGRTYTTLSVNGKAIPWKSAEKYASMIANPRDKKAVLGMIDDINQGHY